MKDASRMTQRVAATASTVLLLGEEWEPEKELFARAIHHLSPRATAPFVALNCAAIPEGLVENELFGHERGAYTGAGARKIGKLELAHRGTLFLDEIGELPLSIQSKLLRVLEEQKFERVGGTQEIEVNVRILTATNKDLHAAVAAKTFREDLYFRISAVPITVPRCASAETMCYCLPNISLNASDVNFASLHWRSPRTPSNNCSFIHGREMYASCKMRSNAPPYWQMTRESTSPDCNCPTPSRSRPNFRAECSTKDSNGKGLWKRCHNAQSSMLNASKFKTHCANRSGTKHAPRRNWAYPTKPFSTRFAHWASRISATALSAQQFDQHFIGN